MNITENSNASKYNNTGYYLTPDLSQRLDLISHLLANTQLVPFIQAAEGCGKTRLRQHLAEILADRYTIFQIEGESGISAKVLRSQLSEATGAAPHEIIDDEQLAVQINALHEQNRSLLVLVDDVEQLPAETLTWLTEIITSPKQTFFIKCVIFAAVDVLALPLSPVLLSTLNDSIQTLDIPHITPEHLPGFVASVDPLKSAVIDEVQYAALMKNSSGIIGKILWQLQYIDNKPVPQQQMDAPAQNKMKPLYVVAGILFVSALASILIFQDEINLSVSDGETQQKETQLEVINLPLPPPVVTVKVTDEKPLQENVASPEQPLPPDPEPEVTEVSSEPTEQIDTDISEISDISSGQETTEGKTEAHQQETSPDMEPEAKTGDEIQLASAPETVSDEDDNELKVEPEQLDNTLEEANKAEVAVTVEKPQVDQESKEPLPTPEPALPVEKPKQGENIQNVDWILNQPDKHYTLQLLAVSDEKGIKRFIKLHEFKGNLVILKTKRNGKPWYALLFEAYASRDEALSARKNLPASYKSSSAWPRSILSIRQAIEAN